jgi:hypothetical protein
MQANYNVVHVDGDVIHSLKQILSSSPQMLHVTTIFLTGTVFAV